MVHPKHSKPFVLNPDQVRGVNLILVWLNTCRNVRLVMKVIPNLLKGKENTSHTFSWKLYLITVSNTVSIATNSIHVVHDDTYWNCNGWSLRIYMIPADAFLPQKYLHKYNYGYLMNSVTQARVWLREYDLLFLVFFNYIWDKSLVLVFQPCTAYGYRMEAPFNTMPEQIICILFSHLHSQVWLV